MCVGQSKELWPKALCMGKLPTQLGLPTPRWGAMGKAGGMGILCPQWGSELWGRCSARGKAHSWALAGFFRHRVQSLGFLGLSADQRWIWEARSCLLPAHAQVHLYRNQGTKWVQVQEADLEPSDLRQVWEELEELFGIGQDFYSSFLNNSFLYYKEGWIF